MPAQPPSSDEDRPKPAPIAYSSPRPLTDHERFERNGWIGLIATLVISATAAIIWMVHHHQ